MRDDIFCDDDYFMGLAIGEARAAAQAGEVPVGAVVVKGMRVLGRGHNLTETLRDVTAHAEMLAIGGACSALGSKYLVDCTLYVTVEPCPMCAGAIGWAQLSRMVVGADDPRRGYRSIARPDASPLHPRTSVTFGVRADECAALMKDFFKSRR